MTQSCCVVVILHVSKPFIMLYEPIFDPVFQLLHGRIIGRCKTDEKYGIRDAVSRLVLLF